MQADLAHIVPKNPGNRFYNKELGGGALLDLGVYPVSLALYMLGNPGRIQVSCNRAKTGVDETMAVDLHYSDGKMAQLFFSFVIQSEQNAVIYGDKGYIRIHPSWFRPSQASLHFNDGRSESTEFAYSGNGYQYQIEECHRCLKEGKTESALMPHRLSLDVMRTLDRIAEIAGG